MIAIVQKFPLRGLKTQNFMVSSALLMDPTRVVYLDPTRGLTVSH